MRSWPEITELEQAWSFTVLITDRDGRQQFRYSPEARQRVAYRLASIDPPAVERLVFEPEPWVEVVEVEGRHMLRPGREWHPKERQVGEKVVRSDAAQAVFDRLWPLREHFIWFDPPEPARRGNPFPMWTAELQIRLSTGDMVTCRHRIAPEMFEWGDRAWARQAAERELLDGASRELVRHLQPVRREVRAVRPWDLSRRGR